MESTSGRSLSRDTVDNCLLLLKRAQEQKGTTSRERKAALELAEFLAHYDCNESSDTDDALDEPSRALLASYTDSYWRMYPSGLDALSQSPSSRQSFHSSSQRSLGRQETLTTELDKLDDWCEFDVFKVAELTGGRPLETVALALLERFDLLRKLDLDRGKLAAFLQEVEATYDASVPYHNSTHAADVVQSLGCMLANDAFSDRLSDLELLAMVLAAAVHDVGHPGLSNEFLVNSGADVALQYNDSSVNENMHAATAFRLLRRPGNNFLSALPAPAFRFVRRTVIAIVLATDMATHTELLADFVAHVRVYGPELGGWRLEHRIAALQMAVHSADIANPAKPARFSRAWTQRIMDEFFAQGEREKEAGLPVSPQCDRDKVDVATSQLAFLERVVRPCYSALASIAPTTAGLALRHVGEACAVWGASQKAPATEPADNGGH